MRTYLLTIIATLGLTAPVAGIAQSYYLTPEQVLQENNGAFLVPGRSRGAQWAADLQSQQSIDRHPSIIREPWDPVQDNGLPPPVAVYDDPGPAAYAPAPTTYGNLDPMTVRLLARLEQQNSLLQSQFAYNGYPLAQTGPAAILSVLAMIGATVWTIRRARGMERFVREF